MDERRENPSSEPSLSEFEIAYGCDRGPPPELPMWWRYYEDAEYRAAYQRARQRWWAGYL